MCHAPEKRIMPQKLFMYQLLTAQTRFFRQALKRPSKCYPREAIVSAEVTSRPARFGRGSGLMSNIKWNPDRVPSPRQPRSLNWIIHKFPVRVYPILNNPLFPSRIGKRIAEKENSPIERGCLPKAGGGCLSGP